MSDRNEAILKVMLATSDAERLARDALRSVMSERHRVASRHSMLDRKRAEAESAAADERALAKLLSRVFPVVGNWIGNSHRTRAGALEDEASSLRVQMDRFADRQQSLEVVSRRLYQAAERLVAASRAVPQLGLPPLSVERRAEAVSGSCAALLRGRRGLDWAARSVETAEEAVGTIRDWAKLRIEADKASRVPMLAPAVIRQPARRIYLPIPSSLFPTARDLGAKRDEKAGGRMSPWYVTTDTDLKPFRNLLPLAFRPTPTGLTFPPVPYRASGQNLWSFFDRDSWRRIRTAAADSAGHRCILCGQRGGFIADKVLGEAEKRHGVDCHEVWDWSVEDPATGIGVQKLKRLLVVCPGCHAAFHGGYFAKRGEEVGLGDEVREHIERRRMLIARTDLPGLETVLEASREELSRVQGVDSWIVDLEHVGQQQFMTDHVAVMNERNAAGVPPERIAGLAFETESGIRYEARTAEEIYAELTIEDSGPSIRAMR